jgi:thioredoxin 1
MVFCANELNNKNFSREIENNNYPVFVDFWAAWCPPCRMMDPVIEELAEEFKEKVIIRKLNTDLYRNIADKLNISGIPTYIIFYKGKEVWRNVGAMGKRKLREVLDNVKSFNLNPGKKLEIQLLFGFLTFLLY